MVTASTWRKWAFELAIAAPFVIALNVGTDLGLRDWQWWLIMLGWSFGCTASYVQGVNQERRKRSSTLRTFTADAPSTINGGVTEVDPR